MLGSYLNLSTEYCFIVEDEVGTVCGYILAALDTEKFQKMCEVAWITELRTKYPCNENDILDEDHGPQEVRNERKYLLKT